ncbi:MAG TPA: hypothetical protein DGT21_24630 [Armatimonadetes bacterium]|jgi:hypothetical protein|nr:hypothetical protein [Armatimonadota bacterium]
MRMLLLVEMRQSAKWVWLVPPLLPLVTMAAFATDNAPGAVGAGIELVWLLIAFACLTYAAGLSFSLSRSRTAIFVLTRPVGRQRLWAAGIVWWFVWGVLASAVAVGIAHLIGAIAESPAGAEYLPGWSPTEAWPWLWSVALPGWWIVYSSFPLGVNSRGFLLSSATVSQRLPVRESAAWVILLIAAFAVAGSLGDDTAGGSSWVRSLRTCQVAAGCLGLSIIALVAGYRACVAHPPLEWDALTAHARSVWARYGYPWIVAMIWMGLLLRYLGG